MTASRPTLGAVVLAAGRSKRFGGSRPKVLHPLCGRPLIVHVLETLREVHRTLKLKEVRVVVSPGKDVERALASEAFPFPITYAVQKDPTGTGDAARVGLKGMAPSDEVIVVAADMPLVRPSSLVALVRTRRESNAAGALLSAIASDPPAYGRIVRSDGWITGIVEAKDATPELLDIREVNLCTYAFAREALAQALPKLKADNAQGERYLTDVAAELRRSGQHLTSVEGDIEEVLGTNTRAELASVGRIMRKRIAESLMDKGVTIVDPLATYIDAGITIGQDTVIHPNTYLEGSTRIGADCEIGPMTRLVDTTVSNGATVTFAHAREAKIGPQASVGPFARLRPGTVLGRGVEVGSFGELKNAKLGDGVKSHHFGYLGDVTIGRGSNIGAGTITCNYDGASKHATTIGSDVFIGSDTVLVAPVRVGRGAYTGAGSVVTRDVAAGGLVYGVPAVPKKRGGSKKRAPAKKARKKKPKRRGS